MYPNVGQNEGRKNGFHQIQQGICGAQFCSKLSAISRQPFRSRFRCCACIFSSRKKKQKKRCQSAFYQRRAAAAGAAPGLTLAVGSVQGAHLAAEVQIPTVPIFVVKFAFCAPPLPSFTKRYFLSSPTELWAVRLAEGDDACQPVLFFPPSTVHPQLSARAAANTHKRNNWRLKLLRKTVAFLHNDQTRSKQRESPHEGTVGAPRPHSSRNLSPAYHLI